MPASVAFSAAGQDTRALWYTRSEPTVGPAIRDTTLLVAPGAGAGQDHPFLVALVRALVAHGIETVTFDFPYVAAGRRRPDRADVLERAWRDAIEMVRGRCDPATRLFIGGKSMGGRLATHVAASSSIDLGIAGIVCFGYPLNPPYRAEPRSVAHLAAIEVPLLVLQGTRDAFGGPQDIIRAAADARHVEVVAIEDADHSFGVPRRTGITPAQVLAGLASTVAGWMTKVLDGGS